MDTLKERLAEIRRRCDDAASAAGRDPSAIDLLAVTKHKDIPVIREALDAGQSAFGENYVSEALLKIRALRDCEVRWCFIGRIDQNKTRQIAENFDWVLSLSSDRAARSIDEHRPRIAPPLQVCVQINIDDDANKAGVRPAALPALIDTIHDLRHIQLRGLMTIPRQQAAGTDARPFHDLAELFSGYVSDGQPWDTLSMGMSADFEAAIAAGATQIRIGRALFGERPVKGR